MMRVGGKLEGTSKNCSKITLKREITILLKRFRQKLRDASLNAVPLWNI